MNVGVFYALEKTAINMGKRSIHKTKRCRKDFHSYKYLIKYLYLIWYKAMCLCQKVSIERSVKY